MSAPGHLARTWFAGLLRDGFALSVVGENPTFARLGAEALRGSLAGLPLNRSIDDAVEHVMGGFAALGSIPTSSPVCKRCPSSGSGWSR